MMQIPIQPEANQIVKTVVGGQNVQILLQQKPRGIFVDVNADGVDISAGVLALNETPLISRDYMGFEGNLYFIDTQGAADPEYTGLGERFQLVYIDAAEYELVRK